jgi:hypothetical protein
MNHTIQSLALKTLPVVLAMVSPFFTAEFTQAAILQPTVIKDELLFLKVEWKGSGLSDQSSPDVLQVPNLNNWEILYDNVPPPPFVNLVQTSQQNLNSWRGEIRVRHKTDPHAGENGGGQKAVLSILFKDTNLLSDFAKADPSHPPKHRDSYRLDWTYTKATDSLTVTLTGVHTPEPTSTLSLLALGTLGAASTLKRKLKSSKPSEKETTKVG